MNDNPAITNDTAYHEHNADVETGLQLISHGWRVMARGLWHIRQHELWRVGGYASFKAYLLDKLDTARKDGYKIPGYVRTLEYVQSLGFLLELENAGLVLDADNENQVRVARDMVKALDLLHDADNVVKIVHSLLGGRIDTMHVKALTSVLQQGIETGAITAFTGETIPLVAHAVDSLAFEEGKRTLEHARAKSISEADLCEQLDLYTDNKYTIARVEIGYEVSTPISDGEYIGANVLSDGKATIYDALFDAVKTLYIENGRMYERTTSD